MSSESDKLAQRKILQLSKFRELKEVRRIEKERRKLWKATWDAPEIPLEKPYQRGWVRWFEWSKEAQRRKDFEVMKGVMELIQVKEWSIRRDFRPPRKRGVRYAKGWHRHLKFTAKELLRKCQDRRLLRYFETWRRHPINEDGYLRELVQQGWGGIIRFRHPHLLVSRVEPHMITHQKVILPEVEARLSELERWIDSRGGWEWVDGQLYRRKWKPLSAYRRARRRERLDYRDMRSELEEMGRCGVIRAFRVFGEWFWSRLIGVGDWNVPAPFETSFGVCRGWKFGIRGSR
ncbi:MAG: hypothetical protein AAGI48_04230 [Verrucomicrobiota bacterium]